MEPHISQEEYDMLTQELEDLEAAEAAEAAETISLSMYVGSPPCMAQSCMA